MSDSRGVGIAKFDLMAGLEKHGHNFQVAGKLFRLGGGNAKGISAPVDMWRCHAGSCKGYKLA